MHPAMNDVMERTRAARAVYTRVWLTEHALRAAHAPQRACTWAAERRSSAHARLMESLGSATYCAVPIDRREDLTPEAFERSYLNTDTPVVLVGAARHWRAVQEWTPIGFGRRFPEEPIRLLKAGPNETLEPGTGRVTTFGDVIGQMEAGQMPYIRFSTVIHSHPELVEEFDEPWLVRMRCAPRGAGTFGLFLGGEGTATGLHSAMAPNLFVQVHGRRRWTIYPAQFGPFFQPKVDASPFFVSHVDAHQREHEVVSRLPVYEVELDPGDVLFNPAFFWHQVRNLSAGIGVGYRWTSLRQALRTTRAQSVITMTATNPSILRMREQRDLSKLVDTRKR